MTEGYHPEPSGFWHAAYAEKESLHKMLLDDFPNWHSVEARELALERLVFQGRMAVSKSLRSADGAKNLQQLLGLWYLTLP